MASGNEDEYIVEEGPPTDARVGPDPGRVHGRMRGGAGVGSQKRARSHARVRAPKSALGAAAGNARSTSVFWLVYLPSHHPASRALCVRAHR